MDLRHKNQNERGSLILRAYFYFQLTDFYGGVPLILEAPKLSKEHYTGNTKEAVVGQIIVDLNRCCPGCWKQRHPETEELLKVCNCS